VNKVFVLLIRFYQRVISPMTGPSCRFQPTCSQYGIEALNKYSFPKALYLIVKRILRCHPFHPGGYDPLP